MSGYNSQRPGTAHTKPIRLLITVLFFLIVLFYVLFGV